MMEIWESLRSVTTASIAVRLVIATLCGSLIGMEREYKRRPAGFRTHILVCLGAAMTTLTGEYLAFVRHYPTDVTRLGAQVIAGIGFIGAGAIIVSRQRRVTGLTTAAGLWTSAIVGLCIGSGFYEAGLLATLLILIAETLFSKIEYWLLNHAPEEVVYMQYSGTECLNQALSLFQKHSVKVLNMEVTRPSGEEGACACVVFTLWLDKKDEPDALLAALRKIENVRSAERL